MTTIAPRFSKHRAKYIPIILRVIASLVILTAGGVTYYVFGQKPKIETDDGSGTLSGTLVQTVQVENYENGLIISEFEPDEPAGKYTFASSAIVDGKMVTAPTAVMSSVASVTWNPSSQQLDLQLFDGDSVSLDQVRTIAN